VENGLAGHRYARSVGNGTATLSPGGGRRLERLCKRGSDRIRIASGAEGIERMEAHLHGQAFAPHRHDTYAIGITLSGIQTFRFRGERWHCLPGQCHILHPDETHDGGAGTDAGFCYRIVYVDPGLVRKR
jgi:AraC-like ligand binding domain